MRVREKLGGDPSDTSDVEEELPHTPVTCHMFRSAFISEWMGAVGTDVLASDPVVSEMLGNSFLEGPCIYPRGEVPSAHTIYVRKKILVGGSKVPYVLPPVARPGDRKVRPYHFYMYHKQFTRERLSVMTNEKSAGSDPYGASHICGGQCMNHCQPEPNSVNQARKEHHKAMRNALELGQVSVYRDVRNRCKHEPRCFINPAAHSDMQRTIISSNEAEYTAIQRRLHEESLSSLEDNEWADEATSGDESNFGDDVGGVRGLSEDSNSDAEEDL